MKLSPALCLLLCGLFCLVGCERVAQQEIVVTIPEYPPVEAKKVEVGELDFKIGIMTGTVSQGEDEYRGAERVIAKYGADKITHKTYPDNFMTEQEATVTQLQQLAQDPEIKAIIVAQAVLGTIPAIKKIKPIRPDLLFICIAPQADPPQVAQYVDLALNTDDLMRGKTIVEHAKGMGAETFVHYTFPRHMSLEILSRRRAIMRKVCEDQGLAFVSLNAPDPTGDQGIAGSQKFILEDVPRQIEKYGKNTCFFSTNCSMQEPLIRACLDGGAIFTEQCCPSPTHGYPGALGIEITPAIAGDMGMIRQQIGKKISEKGQNGRFGSWAVSIHIVMIEAAVKLAIGKVHGDFELTDMGVVKGLLEETGDIKVDLGRFNENENFLMVISENVAL